VTFVLALVVHVPAASAWGNGSNGGNGYGTHDWVLDEAIRLAGSEGSWVHVQTALLASDDPDNVGYSATLHGFYDNSRLRGGPQEVADVYFQVVNAYRAGDYETASRFLGQMSHYYADVLNPCHASSLSLGRTALHAAYEWDVGPFTRWSGQNQDWITPRAPALAADVRAKAVAGAAFARKLYPVLLAEYTRTGTFDVGAEPVLGVTRQALNRAANDLADIVRSVPVGAGLAPAPAQAKADMSRHDPDIGNIPNAFVICRDAKGEPIEGVGVAFTWHLPSGDVTYIRYSDPHGRAKDYHRVVAEDLGHKIKVTTAAASSGQMTTSTTYVTPRIRLAYGTHGLRASVSSAHPSWGTVVTARAAVRDTHGRPLAGLRVTFTWRYASGNVTGSAVTDASGVARIQNNIGQARRGSVVKVTTRISLAGRSATTSFVPK
jgi:hypothetical protein